MASGHTWMIYLGCPKTYRQEEIKYVDGLEQNKHTMLS